MELKSKNDAPMDLFSLNDYIVGFAWHDHKIAGFLLCAGETKPTNLYTYKPLQMSYYND